VAGGLGRRPIATVCSWPRFSCGGGGLIVQYSWPGPVPPGRRRGTIRLIRCARCNGPLYQTKLKGRPRQDDHEQGCQAFITAIRVERYADELKSAASRPNQGGRRSNRRWKKYLLENAKKLSAAACEPDPVAAVRDLSDRYQAECQARGTSAENTRTAEMLMKACQRLALGEAPAPVVSGPV
jgi:hypothetical protein